MIQKNYLIENPPDTDRQETRRSFIKKLAGGMAVGSSLVYGAPAMGSGSPVDDLDILAPKNHSNNESYWKAIRAQFILDSDLALMNAANLCPSPYQVMEMVFNYTRDLDQDASFQNRGKYREIREETREKMAWFLGAQPQEIALVRNTSEANNVISSGYHLKAGDEILLSDLNHPSNKTSWEVKARRYGFKINYVSVPLIPESEDDIVKAFNRAYTPATKLITFTHVSNTTGLVMPAKKLCAAARQRGVFSLVDGAQSFGALQIDLTDMGCDAYSGSAHKWFMGPKEVGVLYVRHDKQNEVWPSIVAAGWNDDIDNAQKYEILGQRDDAALAATGRGVDFHKRIGRDRIENRMRQIATAIKKRLSDLPEIKLSTSLDPSLSAGVVIFKPGNLNSRKTFQKLYGKYHIAGAAMGPNIRLSPHIYNTLDEVDRVISAVEEMLREGI